MMNKGASFTACSFVLVSALSKGICFDKNTQSSYLEQCWDSNSKFAISQVSSWTVSPLHSPAEVQHLVLSFLEHWFPLRVLPSPYISLWEPKTNCRAHIQCTTFAPSSPHLDSWTTNAFSMELTSSSLVYHDAPWGVAIFTQFWKHTMTGRCFTYQGKAVNMTPIPLFWTHKFLLWLVNIYISIFTIIFFIVAFLRPCDKEGITCIVCLCLAESVADVTAIWCVCGHQYSHLWDQYGTKTKMAFWNLHSILQSVGKSVLPFRSNPVATHLIQTYFLETS